VLAGYLPLSAKSQVDQLPYLVAGGTPGILRRIR